MNRKPLQYSCFFNVSMSSRLPDSSGRKGRVGHLLAAYYSRSDSQVSVYSNLMPPPFCPARWSQSLGPLADISLVHSSLRPTVFYLDDPTVWRSGELSSSPDTRSSFLSSPSLPPPTRVLRPYQKIRQVAAAAVHPGQGIDLPRIPILVGHNPHGPSTI